MSRDDYNTWRNLTKSQNSTLPPSAQKSKSKKLPNSLLFTSLSSLSDLRIYFHLGVAIIQTSSEGFSPESTKSLSDSTPFPLSQRSSPDSHSSSTSANLFAVQIEVPDSDVLHSLWLPRVSFRLSYLSCRWKLTLAKYF